MTDGMLSPDACLMCNICTTACPVLRVSEHFPGPKAVGPQAHRFRHPRLNSPNPLVTLCSGCGVCSRVCPQAVPIAELNIRAKISEAQQRRIPLRDHLISRPDLLGKWGSSMAPLANSIIRSTIFRWVLEKLLQVSRDAPLPEFSPKPLAHRIPVRHTLAPQQSANRKARADAIAYFHGCGTNYYEPELGELTISILQAMGFQVLVPSQQCCGLPLQSNGLVRSARRKAHNMVRSLAPYAHAGIPIIGTSPSCTYAVKHDYISILGMNDELTRLVAANTYDLFEFLHFISPESLPPGDLAPVPGRALYHPPCQLRSHGLGLPALKVLAMIPELLITLSNSECCGAAGTYGLKCENYSLATQVGSDLFAQLASEGPDFILCDSDPCRWWISHHSNRPVQHPIQLLAASMGIQ